MIDAPVSYETLTEAFWEAARNSAEKGRREFIWASAFAQAYYYAINKDTVTGQELDVIMRKALDALKDPEGTFVVEKLND